MVIDTNIFVSAVMNKDGAPREVLELAPRREITAIMGNALFSEYEDVLSRDALFDRAPLDRKECDWLFNALLSVKTWISVYYLWRPNLVDEADNHLIELAIAGRGETSITANKKDFAGGELAFENLSVRTAGEFLKIRS